MLEVTIPQLMSRLPQDELELKAEQVTGGVFDLISNNPFQSGASEGKREGTAISMKFCRSLLLSREHGLSCHQFVVNFYGKLNRPVPLTVGNIATHSHIINVQDEILSVHQALNPI